MFDWIINIFRWLNGLWEMIPESIKEKIIEEIVDTFESSFRDFYRSNKQGGNNE